MERLLKQKKNGEDTDGLVMFESMMQRAEKSNTVLDPERMASNGGLMLFAGKFLYHMEPFLPPLVSWNLPRSRFVFMTKHTRNLINMTGTETTALALSTAIFHMTKQPDLWLELDRQLRASLPEGSRDEYLDITALEKVPLLDATAKESLRVGCPIPGSLPRVVPEGGWQLRGEMIPAGVRPTKPFPPPLKAMRSATFRIRIILCVPKYD